MDCAQEAAGGPLINPAVGKLVQRLRKAKGLGQRDLAKPLGVTAWQVSRYECCHAAISEDHLRIIAEVLDEDFEKFSAPTLVECTEREVQFLVALRRIPSDEGWESALRVVNAIGAMQEHASC